MSQTEIKDLEGRIYNLRGRIDVLSDMVRMLTAADRAEPESLIYKHISDALCRLPKDNKNDYDLGKQHQCRKLIEP